MPGSSVAQPLIKTARLELHHIDATALVRLFECPEDTSIYAHGDFTNPYRELLDERGPLVWRVPQVKENPSLNRWFLRWIVDRARHEIVGSTSFHGAPDPAGMVEIGLGINGGFRRQGYGTEALIGMWSWVIQEAGVRTLRYTVSAANRPSVGLIEQLDFAHVGVQIDDVDGPEEIYEMSAEAFRRRHAIDWRTGTAVRDGDR